MTPKPQSLPLETPDTTYDHWRALRQIDPEAFAKRRAEILDKEDLTDEDVNLLRFSIGDAAKSDNVDKAIETGKWLVLLQSRGYLPTRESYTGLRHTYSHCQKLMQLASETPRMSQLIGKKRPNSAMACYTLIAYDSRTGLYNISDDLFAEIISKDWFGTDTSTDRLTEWIRRYKRKEFKLATGTVPAHFLDTVTGGDAFELISQIPDNSLDAIITSPPFGDQRSAYYPSLAPPETFHLRWAEFMRLVYPKLKTQVRC